MAVYQNEYLNTAIYDYHVLKQELPLAISL